MKRWYIISNIRSRQYHFDSRSLGDCGSMLRKTLACTAGFVATLLCIARLLGVRLGDRGNFIPRLGRNVSNIINARSAVNELEQKSLNTSSLDRASLTLDFGADWSASPFTSTRASSVASTNVTAQAISQLQTRILNSTKKSLDPSPPQFSSPTKARTSNSAMLDIRIPSI